MARRRVGLGIETLVEFAALSGVDRKAIARAERGEASDNTLLRLESWLDRREAQVRGAEVPTVMANEGEGPDAETIRVHVTGPHAEWKVLVEGPRGDGEELARLAAEVASQVRKAMSPPG